MNEQQLKDLAEAEKAEVLQNYLKEAFETLEKECFEAFKASDIHDDAGRKTCRIYLKVLEDVKQRFSSAISNGNVTRKKLLSVKDNRFKRIVNG